MHQSRAFVVFGRHLTLVALAAFCSVAVMRAAPVLNAADWTTAGPTPITVASVTGGGLSFSYSDPAGYSGLTWSFTNNAPAATGETVGFQWEHSGFYAYFAVTEYVDAFVTHDGTTTFFNLNSAGPANCCSAPSNGFDYSGTASLTIQAGDTYGFEVGGNNGDSNRTFQGTFTLSETSATPSNSVPEPATLLLVLPGLLAFLRFRARSV